MVRRRSQLNSPNCRHSVSLFIFIFSRDSQQQLLLLYKDQTSESPLHCGQVLTAAHSVLMTDFIGFGSRNTYAENRVNDVVKQRDPQNC